MSDDTFMVTSDRFAGLCEGDMVRFGGRPVRPRWWALLLVVPLLRWLAALRRFKNQPTYYVRNVGTTTMTIDVAPSPRRDDALMGGVARLPPHQPVIRIDRAGRTRWE